MWNTWELNFYKRWMTFWANSINHLSFKWINKKIKIIVISYLIHIHTILIRINLKSAISCNIFHCSHPNHLRNSTVTPLQPPTTIYYCGGALRQKILIRWNNIPTHAHQRLDGWWIEKQLLMSLASFVSERYLGNNKLTNTLGTKA